MVNTLRGIDIVPRSRNLRTVRSAAASFRLRVILEFWQRLITPLRSGMFSNDFINDAIPGNS